MNQPTVSFLARHEFLIRRLHSLTGIVPIGVFLCIHLAVNASVIEDVTAFQKAVYQIHSLGGLLPFVEWALIFLPILFHGILGVLILLGGSSNTGDYPYAENYRYLLQRATGLIAGLFILWHVFHMHGWFHFRWWIDGIAAPLGGALFRPFHAASTAGAALQNGYVTTLYLIGILASVFHLANGLWTAGITWGIWTSPNAQKKIWRFCAAFGIILAAIGTSALFGMRHAGKSETFETIQGIENRMYEIRVELGDIRSSEDKRS
ncbi:MAG: succinate dehydrogenase cytochrome b558 subunit [Pirellulales bacterium]|nr:succinate dehydrogenase cytochrome b558 subunit [Pirellulales bacterium]